MQKKIGIQILQVVLGIVIGALVTFSIVRYRERQHLFRTENRN